ncbi:hypothetical protein LINPERHAP2_LOCUS22629 [Linum perenne]
MLQLETRCTNLPTNTNRAEEDRIRAKLELVLWQEDALWVQKSRSKWIVEGDRNTQFFHMSALKRCSFNRIKRLRLGDDVWEEDQKKLSLLEFEHFRDFYSREGTPTGKIVGFSGWWDDALKEGWDELVWGLEVNGRFTIKLAYNLLQDKRMDSIGASWQKVWRWQGPNKIRHFMWLVAQGKLMTNVERAR